MVQFGVLTICAEFQTCSALQTAKTLVGVVRLLILVKGGKQSQLNTADPSPGGGLKILN